MKKVLLCWAAAIWLAAGCAADKPRPDNLEILIQQGHANTRGVGLDLMQIDGRYHALTSNGTELRAWESAAGADGPWTLKRVWSGRQGTHLRFGRDNDEFWFIATQTTSHIYATGRWGTPLLTRKDGLFPCVNGGRNILPDSPATTPWRGIVLRECEDANGNGYREERLVFFSPNGKDWKRLELAGAPKTLTGSEGLGDGVYAVEGYDSNPKERYWKLYSIDENFEWQPFALEDFPERIDEIGDLGDDRGFFVRSAGNPRQWYLATQDDKGAHRWTRASKLLAGAPAEIESIEFVGGELVIAVRAGDRTRHYLRDAQDNWQKIRRLLSPLPQEIVELETFAGGELVAVRAAAEVAYTRHRSNWGYFMRDRDGTWKRLDQVVPTVPRRIWRVADFAQGRGFGVQEFASIAPKDRGFGGQHVVGAGVYEWKWYTRGPKKWERFDTRLAEVEAAPRQIAAIEADDVERLVSVQEMSDSNQNGEHNEWLHYAHRPGAGWMTLANYVASETEHAPPDIARAQYDGDDGVLQIEDRAGNKWHYLWSDDGLTFVDPGALSSGARRRVAHGELFPHISHSSVRAAAVLELTEGADANENGLWNEKRYLIRKPSGEWAPMGDVTGLSEISGVEGSTAEQLVGVSVADDKQVEKRFFVRHAGEWHALSRWLPKGPAKVRDALLFFGTRGVGVQDQGDSDRDGEFGEWHYWLRSSGGKWQPLSRVLPQVPARIETVYGLAGEAGIAVQERGDANNNGAAGEWLYFLPRPDGWREVRSLSKLVPRRIWQIDTFAGGAGLVVQEEGDADGDGEAYSRHFFVRDENAGLRRLSEVLSVASIERVLTVWQGRGLAVRASGAWSFWERDKSDKWSRLSLKGAPERIARVRSDAAGRLLAIERVPSAQEALESAGRWRVWVRRPNGFQPLDKLSAEAPESARDISLDATREFVGLMHPGGDDKPEKWTWFDAASKELAEPVGHTGSASWPGLSWERLSSGGMRVEGAAHWVDGVSAKHVPAPNVWFHRRQGFEGAGDVFFAPDVLDEEKVPEDVELVASGERATVVVYRAGPGDTRHVAAFSRGSVEFHQKELALEEGRVEPIWLIYNRRPDGTTRIHRADEPSRWIALYETPAGAKTYYDDRGHFFDASEVEWNSASMSFRNGNDVYSFHQLSAYLFRPDKLEERLGVPAGSFFTELTERDRKDIARAKRLSKDGEVSVASLHPPNVQLGGVPAKVDTDTATLEVNVVGYGVSADAITARVLGAGQSKGILKAPSADTDAEQQQRVTTEVSVRLMPGKNIIEVTAVDAKQLIDRKTVVVHYKPRKPEKRTLWLGLVSVADYESKLVTDLDYTVADAQKIRKRFEAQTGKLVDELRVTSWCDDNEHCDAGADAETLRRQVPQFFGQMKDGDYALLFVSGHGLQTDGGYHFVPHDYTGEPEDAGRLVGWRELVSWLTAGKVVAKRMLMLDSCHSGALGADDALMERNVRQAYRYQGLYVLSSSAADAESFESDALGSGMFTHVLTRGLAGEANSPGATDETISFVELNKYLYYTVPEISGGKQTVHFANVDPELDFPVYVPEQIRHRVALRVVNLRGGDPLDPKRFRYWRDRLVKEIASFRVVDERIDVHLDIQEMPDAKLKLTVRARDRVNRTAGDILAEKVVGPEELEGASPAEIIEAMLVEAGK